MKTTTKIWLAIAAALVAVSAVFYAGKLSDTSNNEIRVGAVLTLTGPLAYLATAEKAAINAALEDLGPTTPKIKFYFEDSQGKADVATSAVRKMLDVDKANYLVVATTAGVKATLPVARDANRDILFLAQGVAPNLTVGFPFAVRIMAAADEECDILSAYAKAKGLKKIAVAHIRNAYGEEGAKYFDRKAKELGLQVTAIESFGFEDSDHRVLIEKLKATNPDAFFIYGFAGNYPPLLEQMNQAGIKAPILGGINMALNDMEQKVSPDILARVAYPAPKYVYENESAESNSFNTRVRKAGATPTFDGAYFYDLTMMLGKAVRTVGKDDPKAVLQALLAQAPYQGISGVISFNADRDSNSDFKLVRWNDKKIEVIWDPKKPS